MKTEIALNIQPNDKIRLTPEEGWWIVTQHSIDMNAPAPVTMELRSEELPQCFQVLSTNPMQRFQCEPHLC